jgi:hypothetical protein
MQVGLLTTEQKDEITGRQFARDSYFNPIQDLNDNWIISTQEIDQCTNESLIWVKDLTLIEYEPKIYEL